MAVHRIHFSLRHFQPGVLNMDPMVWFGVKKFYKMDPGANVIRLFTAVSYNFFCNEPVFVPGKPFQPSLLFMGKVHVSLGLAAALLANTTLSWVGLRGTDILAYYENS
jgi:hypothetical protein